VKNLEFFLDYATLKKTKTKNVDHNEEGGYPSQSLQQGSQTNVPRAACGVWPARESLYNGLDVNILIIERRKNVQIWSNYDTFVACKSR
jgi:hypothetical protein